MGSDHTLTHILLCLVMANLTEGNVQAMWYVVAGFFILTGLADIGLGIIKRRLERRRSR